MRNAAVSSRPYAPANARAVAATSPLLSGRVGSEPPPESATTVTIAPIASSAAMTVTSIHGWRKLRGREIATVAPASGARPGTSGVVSRVSATVLRASGCGAASPRATLRSSSVGIFPRDAATAARPRSPADG